MKKALMSLAISLAVAFTATVSVLADAPATSPERVKSLDDMTSVELINSMDVDLGKYGNAMQNYQKKVATNLINGPYNPSKAPGTNVELFRNKEVVIVTIPTDLLFLPNDTVVREDARPLLAPIMQFVKENAPDKYRVLLVMHTDNNGSEQYTDNLSLSRVDAVFDWFADNGADTRYIFPTGSGASDPLVPNDTYTNRARNRRLEIFLIPGKQLLSTVKKTADAAQPAKQKTPKSILGIFRK